MILLRGGLIVTVDPGRRIIADGAIAIRRGEIIAVGKDAEVAPRFAEAETIDVSGSVVTPGFVDAHIHVTEHLWRGWVPDDAGVDEWLPRWLLPVYNLVPPEGEHVAALLAQVEMVRSGTTTFADAGTIFDWRAVASAVQTLGMRAVLARWSADSAPWPGRTVRPTRQVLGELEELLQGVTALDDARIGAWPVVLGIGACSDELIREAKALAERHRTGFGMMFAANRQQYVGGEAYGVSHLDRLGVLDARTKLVHVVYVDDADVDLLAERRTKVVFCPTPALHHQKGISRYGKHPEMLARGVTVALGSDSANGSNHANMVRLMWLAANVYKDARMDTRMIPAETAIEMATINGARVLGLEDRIGSIEPGKRADLVVWDTEEPTWRPLLNVTHNLVHATDGRSVRLVLVDGRVIYRDGQFPSLDTRQLYAEADRLARETIAQAGLPIPSRWPLV